MRTVAIVQARMASSRLPNKVLLEIAGEPMLAHVVGRVRRARTIDEVVVATSLAADDDAIEAFCRQTAVACVRGSQQDVLDRYRQAAQASGAEAIVRVTGDCPLHDPRVIDMVVDRFAAGDCDYVANIFRYTFPDGLDAEVFSREALEIAWCEADRPAEREHVTPYMRTSGRFRVANVENVEDLSASNYRWTVDDATDLAFVRLVYARLGHIQDFGLSEVLALVQDSPDVAITQSRAIRNEGYYKSLLDQAVAGAAPARDVRLSRAWHARASRVIPGAAQTFSKGANQYVQGVSPVFLQRGQGCRVWDVDGNEYIDYVQGLLPNILGYAHPAVNAAATDQLSRGHSFSLPHPLEVELAERLTRLIPCAEQVRFGKNGSDATSGAVRAARAFTGRERVACCGYHGWQDWFIGSTSRSAGVPAAVRALTHPFPYNDPDALDRILGSHAGEFAAVVMEPVNFVEPNPGYLASVRELAHRHGALLIFDEICSGFHFGLGGAQKRFDVVPDLAAFGKAMGNGFPISCVVGRKDVMRVFEDVFFSFTFGGEAASLAAAMTVLDVLEGTDALARIVASGRRLQEGFNALAKHSGLSAHLECVGWPEWSLLRFKDGSGQDSAVTRSLFQQEAVKRGILMLVTHNMTAAHDEAAVEETLETYAAVMKTLAGWVADSEPRRFLEGPAIESVFRVRA